MKKNKIINIILLAIVIIAVLVSVSVTFYRTVVLGDFKIIESESEEEILSEESGEIVTDEAGEDIEEGIPVEITEE